MPIIYHSFSIVNENFFYFKIYSKFSTNWGKSENYFHKQQIHKRGIWWKNIRNMKLFFKISIKRFNPCHHDKQIKHSRKSKKRLCHFYIGVRSFLTPSPAPPQASDHQMITDQPPITCDKIYDARSFYNMIFAIPYHL